MLDTPVLTYRDPDTAQPQENDSYPGGSEEGAADTGDELVAPTVAQAFYNYLAGSPLQAIVLENQTPPQVTAEGCQIVYFTGSAGTGRAGFCPTAADTSIGSEPPP